jgi:hypothetical protein
MLMLEISKSLRTDMTGLRVDVKDIAFRVTQLEVGQANILAAISQNFTDFARQQVSIDRINTRLDRIERRLELVDESGA